MLKVQVSLVRSTEDGGSGVRQSRYRRLKPCIVSPLSPDSARIAETHRMCDGNL